MNNILLEEKKDVEVNNYTEEELQEILVKVENFIEYLDEKYGESNATDMNLLKVEEVRNFISDNNYRGMNLELFGLSEYEISTLESLLRVSFVKGAKEIKYEPKVPEGFSKVEDLKKDGVIQEYYWDLVPDKCNACGESIIGNDNLTIIKCSNLRCKHNLASSLRKIAVKESIPGFGNKTCFNYFNDGRVKSVLDVFDQPDGNIYYAVQKMKSGRKREFSEWVKLISLPGIEAQANYLFKGINNYNEYVDAVNKCGGLFNFCLNRLGGEGKQAGNIAQVLEAYDYELQHIEDLFPIGVEAEKIIYLALTGNVYFNLPGEGRFTKQKYLDFINSIYPEYVTFRKTESVNKAFLVISDYESGSSKYRAGKSQNKLISSKDLVNLMLHTKEFLKLCFPNSYLEKVEKLKADGRCFGENKEQEVKDGE